MSGRRTKENSLSAYWSKREKDIVFCYPAKVDGHFLHNRFSNPPWRYDGMIDTAFLDELKARGYDVSTLRFSVMKDPTHKRWAPDEPVAAKGGAP